MKAWNTKYALTDGVKEVEGEIHRENRKYFVFGAHGFETIGLHIHFDKSAALKVAEKARLKKIASLKKQIAKLEKLSFEDQ